MARTYATPADLTAWTTEPAPVNAVGLLRSASTLVEKATITAVYRVDTNGMPLDPRIRSTFKDATCEQAAFWATNNIDPAKGDLAIQSEKIASSKSISGASISYDTNDATVAKQARIMALTHLCETAWAILRNDGLTSTKVCS